MCLSKIFLKSSILYRKFCDHPIFNHHIRVVLFLLNGMMIILEVLMMFRWTKD